MRPIVKERKQALPLPITNPTKWMELYGHTTYASELAAIFRQSPHTICGRLKRGWPVEAALVARDGDGWNINNVHILQSLPWVTDMFKATLDRHFAPPPPVLPKRKIKSKG